MPGEDFSVQLPTAQQGKSIVGPIGSRGGFLGGLADAASTLIGAISTRSSQTQALEEGDYRREVRNALNETAGAVMDAFRNARGNPEAVPPQPDPGAIGSTPLNDITQPNADGNPLQAGLNTGGQADFSAWEGGVPRDVVRAGNDLDRVSAAVTQGRAPDVARELRLETVVDDLFARHPEARAEILTYLHARGYEHYLYRDVVAANADIRAQDDAARAGRTAQMRYAYDHGFANPNVHSPEEAAARGAQAMLNAARLEASRALLTNTETQIRIQGLSGQEADRQRNNAREALTSGVMEMIELRVGPAFQEFAILAGAASTDPEQMARLEQFPARMLSVVETLRSSALGQLTSATPEQRASVMARIDALRDGVVAMTSGPASQWASNRRAVEAISTNFQLGEGRALTVYTMLAGVFGQAEVNRMFPAGVMSSLPDALQRALRSEVTSLTLNMNPNRATVTLSNIRQLLQGNRQLSSMNEPEAVAAMPGLIQGTVMATAEVLGRTRAGLPTPTESVLRGLNGLSNISEAMSSITPGSANAGSLVNASGVFADPNAVAVTIRAGMDAPATREQATAVMIGTRAAAAQSLETLRGRVGRMTDNTGVLHVRVVNGRWVVAGDRTRYNAYSAREAQAGNVTNPGSMGPVEDSIGIPQGGGPGPAPRSYESILARPPQDLQDMATALNRYQDFLVTTISNDTDADMRTMTPVQATNFYANGTVPQNIVESRQRARLATGQLARRISEFETRLERLPTEVATAPESRAREPAGETHYGRQADTVASQYGIPTEGFRALIRQESSWNPRAVGATPTRGQSFQTDALGLGQFVVYRNPRQNLTSAARQYGLIETDAAGNVTVDRRADPELALDAAARYLRDLRQRHGSWRAALRAYGVTASSNTGDMAALEERLARAFGEGPSE